MRLELLTSDVPKLFPFLESILQDGGKKLFSIEGDIQASKFVDGRSGYLISEHSLKAGVELGILFGGSGFVLRRYIQNENINHERFDYFNMSGEFTFTLTIPESLYNISNPLMCSTGSLEILVTRFISAWSFSQDTSWTPKTNKKSDLPTLPLKNWIKLDEDLINRNAVFGTKLH